MHLFIAILNILGAICTAIGAYLLVRNVLVRTPFMERVQAINKENLGNNVPDIRGTIDTYIYNIDRVQINATELKNERITAWWSMGLVVIGLLCNAGAACLGLVYR